MNTFLSRIWGRAYGAYSCFLRDPERYGGKLPAHIEAVWTSPEHFAHSNYCRGHLPQLCIVASGWKARLLALICWPDPPWKEEHEYVVWWKNGDHPNDNVWRPYEDTGKIPTEPREGKVVRYFRHPQISGESACSTCGIIMNKHGFIDYGDGIKVCPGDYVRKDRLPNKYES